jgi:Acyl-CoA thioesterase N-terminal domain
MTEMHAFDRAIALEVVDDEVVRGTTQPEWANMVGPFGGITSAILLRAMESHTDRLGEPVALTVNFAAPITDGEFEISRRAPRTNRTNQHWIAELSQDGEVKTTATAVFGVRRDTWSDAQAVAPDAPPPDQMPRTNHENLPTWVRMYDMRFAGGLVLRRQPGNRPVVDNHTLGARWRRATRRFSGTCRVVRHLLSANLSPSRGGAIRHDFDDDVFPPPIAAISTDSAGTSSWDPRTPTASTVDSSIRTRSCGAVTVRCWSRRTSSSTSRAERSALLRLANPGWR